MDLLKNPFHILGATPRDDRYRIMELAEECSLLSDADACMEARAILTNPRRRIAAEVAWLPGFEKNPDFDQNRYDKVFNYLLDSSNQNLPNITELELIHLAHVPLAHANLLVSKLSRLSNPVYTEWILEIARTSKAITSEAVCAELNEARKVAGFPEITDMSAIDDEIRKQRDYYSKTITAALENLSARARAGVMTSLLERTPINGRCPILIENLIPMYESSVQASLDQIQNIIEAQDQQLRVMANAQRLHTTLASIMDQLCESLREWGTLAQPIQRHNARTGQRHQGSVDMANRLIELAAVLFLEHRKADFSRKILNTLRDVFAEIPEIAEQVEEQISLLTLEDINLRVEELRRASDAEEPNHILTPLVNQLIQTVRTWQPTTQPIELNQAVAYKVREGALHLWNQHQKLDFTIQIITALIGIFRGINGMNEVNNRLSADLITLYEIDQEKKKPETGCLLQIVILAVLGLIGALLQGC